MQLGSRQPCRPPPHTRASMAAACVPGLSRPPSRGGSGPLQATGVAGAQVRGRPKLPTPSACTDGSPYRGRLCAVSRACKVGTEHHFGRFGRFARTCTGTAHSRSGGGAAADGATSRTVVRPFGASEDGPGPWGAPCRQGRQLGRGTPHTPAPVRLQRKVPRWRTHGQLSLNCSCARLKMRQRRRQAHVDKGSRRLSSSSLCRTRPFGLSVVFLCCKMHRYLGWAARSDRRTKRQFRSSPRRPHRGP